RNKNVFRHRFPFLFTGRKGSRFYEETQFYAFFLSKNRLDTGGSPFLFYFEEKYLFYL
ncbi:MAG: hypothetical protein RL757_1187, partial [Bacteroidota bacterium]